MARFPVTLDYTTPDVGNLFTAPSNITGNTTITCGGPGAPCYYAGLDFASGSGGGCVKTVATLVPGFQLNCTVGNGADNGSTTAVYDTTDQTHVNISAFQGGVGNDFGHSPGGLAEATGSLIVGSPVIHVGGVGQDSDGVNGKGGGSGACVTADGLVSSTISGAVSAGVGSGAGGNGNAAGAPPSGNNGSQGGAGGGQGNGLSATRAGGIGSIRFQYYILTSIVIGQRGGFSPRLLGGFQNS